MDKKLSKVNDDILIELKSQFYFNGIQSSVIQPASNYNNLEVESGYELFISEISESRKPLFYDFGIKSGWAWPGSIFGKSFKFRADLMYNGNSIWIGDVYSSYDKVLAENIIGEGISKRFLKGMKKENLLPQHFNLVKYSLKYDQIEELYSDKR